MIINSFLSGQKHIKKHFGSLVLLFLVMIMLPISPSFGQNKTNESNGPKNGTLLITGDGIYWAKDLFMELIGGLTAPIVVIPTAASSEELSDEFLENYQRHFWRLGFKNVTVLHTRDPKEANTEAFVQPIKNAKAVVFSGGRQWRHADSYLNTKAHKEFFKLLDRGGVIAGGSAGATIQGSYLARGDTKGNTKMMGDHEEGLGFLKNVAIDQHLFKRNRQFDMFEILDHRPELLGIGLDEGTGIVVTGDKFEVVGSSYAAIYDGTRWSRERDTIYQLPKGSREFYVLKAGDTYNLKTRSVITYRNREFMELSESELAAYCGEYQLKGSTTISKIYLENKTLLSEVNGQVFQLLPESKTRFYISKTETYLDFVFDSNGETTKVVIPNQNQTWEKQR